MTRDPHGQAPEPPPVRRYVQDPVPPPPTVKQRAQTPRQPPPPPPGARSAGGPPPPPPAGAQPVTGLAGPRRDLDPDRWGYGTRIPTPSAPPPPPPPPPVASRRGPSGKARAAIVTAILIAAAAVVVAVVVTSGGNAPTSTVTPVSVVQTYLRDLAGHDASGALAQGPDPTSRDLLTDNILLLQQQVAPITRVQVSSAGVDGDHARVRAQYRFGSRDVDTTYALTRTDGAWKLDRTTFRIDVSMLSTVPSATVFDKPVGGVRSIEVFPGPVQWGSGNKYFVVSQKNADRFAVSPSDPNASYAEISAALNSDGIAAIRDASAAFVKACAASQSLHPPKCPQDEYGQHGVKDSAKWTVTTPLNPALKFGPGQEELTTFTVMAELRWTCVYSVRTRNGGTRRVTDRAVQGTLTGSVDLTAAKPVLTASI